MQSLFIKEITQLFKSFSFWGPAFAIFLVSFALSMAPLPITTLEQILSTKKDLLFGFINFFIGYGMIILSRTVCEEKSCKISELLLTSVTPKQILITKISAILLMTAILFILAALPWNCTVNRFCLIKGGLYDNAEILWGILYLCISVLIYGPLFMITSLWAPDEKSASTLSALPFVLLILQGMVCKILTALSNQGATVVTKFVPYFSISYGFYTGQLSDDVVGIILTLIITCYAFFGIGASYPKLIAR